MSKHIPPPTPELNRLRAAAGLIPIIESGLSDSKLSVERAALMASFCEWITEKRSTDPEAIKLAESVDEGLKRIKMALAFAMRNASVMVNLGSALLPRGEDFAAQRL